MKILFKAMCLFGFIAFIPCAQARPLEMSQQEAVKFLADNAHLACEDDKDCILTGDSCGRLIAVTESMHEEYAVAVALGGDTRACQAIPPQNTSDYEAICNQNYCNIKIHYD